MSARNLADWLDYIERVHPREIELGLERVRAVAARMLISRPGPLVITVAGTNGKGSCVATLEALLEQSGYRTASYTSPHIHVFNERIRIGAANVSDAEICAALAVVDSQRAGVSLSYFEFATLAALWLFQNANVQVAILEVGLGGRLDAVNLIDADVAIIASIRLDHQDWLGDNVESIGAEKAGILRAGRPALYAAPKPPLSIVARAHELAAPLLQLGVDFGYSEHAAADTWDWFGASHSGASIRWENLPRPVLALSNVAAAIQALHLLPVQLSRTGLANTIGRLALAGRCELRTDLASGRRVLFDVAHNPAGAAMLAENLQRLRGRNPGLQRVIAVVAVLADKDVEGMVTALETFVDIWYIAQVEVSRCLSADTAVKRITATGLQLHIEGFDSVQQAYLTACAQATAQDLVLVTGSFHTVAAVREMSHADSIAIEAPTL